MVISIILVFSPLELKISFPNFSTNPVDDTRGTVLRLLSTILSPNTVLNSFGPMVRTACNFK